MPINEDEAETRWLFGTCSENFHGNIDKDLLLYGEIGGRAGQLLKENKQAMMQVSKNMEAQLVEDNTQLLAKVRQNLFFLCEELIDMPRKLFQLLL